MLGQDTPHPYTSWRGLRGPGRTPVSGGEDWPAPAGEPDGDVSWMSRSCGHGLGPGWLRGQTLDLLGGPGGGHAWPTDQVHLPHSDRHGLRPGGAGVTGGDLGAQVFQARSRPGVGLVEGLAELRLVLGGGAGPDLGQLGLKCLPVGHGGQVEGLSGRRQVRMGRLGVVAVAQAENA